LAKVADFVADFVADPPQLRQPFGRSALSQIRDLLR
jgi:hypothetical protein